jgi:hypothetical protein
MKRQDCTIRHLLLSYVSLLAERESYGPGDGFEYVLWDDLMRPVPELVSREERAELASLVIMSDHWVSFNMQTGMLQLIDIDAWRSLLERRDH